MIRVKIKKKTEMMLWVLVGVILGTAALAEAAEYWQNEPSYGPYHSQYRYTQTGRYPENPQGEYAGAYPENRAWEYGYQNSNQGRYPENRGYAGYPPESAPRDYTRDPRGYPEPQRGYGPNSYGSAPQEYVRNPRGGGYSDPPQLQRRDARGGSWYPPESTPREPAYAPRGGYPRDSREAYARTGYPPQSAQGYRDPRGRYSEPPREYGRAEYSPKGGEKYPAGNVPQGYGRPRGGYAENPAYTRGGYPSERGAREYDRDPRGGYVPAPSRREYDRGGYPPRYPESGYGYREGWGYPRSGYFDDASDGYQERYENILQEYLGRRYPEPGSPAAPYYYPYRY